MKTISILMLAGCLTGCAFGGPTVMMSKGQSGGFSELFQGDVSYCKLTASEGVTVTDETQAAFEKYCGNPSNAQ